MKKPNMDNVCMRLRTTVIGEAVMAVTTPEDKDYKPAKAEILKAQTMLAKIHRNAAHCGNATLARVLRDDQAPSWVIELAENFECEACKALGRPSISPAVSLSYETKPWQTVYVDNAELELGDRVVTFSLYEDAAMSLVVPHVLFERSRNEHRNPTGDEVCDSFSQTWLSHYPKPARVRTDPEGAFQSDKFRDFLALNDIFYQPAAGEAHHQPGLIERGIQTVKRAALKVAREFPGATGTQILATVAAAHNELHRRQGYSPNQWAFGRAQPMWERGGRKTLTR